jgi:hypothetical protein
MVEENLEKPFYGDEGQVRKDVGMATDSPCWRWPARRARSLIAAKYACSSSSSVCQPFTRPYCCANHGPAVAHFRVQFKISLEFACCRLSGADSDQTLFATSSVA